MIKKPFISVIVTTYNNIDVIENCLKSIKNQTFKDFELIVVDENSADGTQKIAKRYANQFINKGNERCQKRNIGAEYSKSDYLFFIDSDMELPSKIIQEIHKLLDFNTLVMVPELSFGKGFWAKSKAFERSFYKGGDRSQGVRVYPKKVFIELKGFDEKVLGAEDLDLFHRIKEKKKKIKVLETKNYILHNEGNLKYFQIIKRMIYYSKSFAEYKRRHPQIFKKQLSIIRYIRKWKDMIRHPLLTFGFLLIKIGEASVVLYSIKKYSNYDKGHF
ncbi:MAG: glycosyltransferase family A protein [Candidatus Pacearchaeota archaeon]|nr:glycosyltransferase family A protein [Candidatus Pacearchaeota archaeon]